MKYFHWDRIEFKELLPDNGRALSGIFSSLGNRNFRLYFLGQCVSLCGSWIQNIAMSWLMYRLTGSVLLLATVTFTNLIPSLLLTPLSGVLSDRFNRYRIILTTQTLFMLQAVLLAVLTLSGVVQVWQILCLSLFAGIVSAMEAPARQSFYTRLVDKKDMSNAIALNSVAINGSRFIGPTIGGFMIAVVGEGYCFLINALSYVAVLAALLMLHLPKYVPQKVAAAMLGQLREGFDYIRSYLPMKVVLLLVASVSFFGMPFMTMIPAVVKDILRGDSNQLGFMMSSIGGGAVVAALYLAARKHVRGLGRVVTISVVMFGGGIALLSFVDIPWLAYIICFPVGFGMIATMASCNTLLQTLVDDDKRGRVMSFYTMAFVGMNPVGSMFFGSLTEYAGLKPVLFICGTVCLIAAAIYEYFRPVVRDAARDPHSDRDVIPEIASGIGNPDNNPF